MISMAAPHQCSGVFLYGPPGDWWAYGEHGYGDRKALVESEDWEGPAFQTCMHAASISRAFDETCRRRQVLTFNHHVEVAPLCDRHPDIADRLLDWCTTSPGPQPPPLAAKLN
jgi:hypothetical protein